MENYCQPLNLSDRHYMPYGGKLWWQENLVNSQKKTFGKRKFVILLPLDKNSVILIVSKSYSMKGASCTWPDYFWHKASPFAV